MGTLRAHKTGGYASDGSKLARKTYYCEVCGQKIYPGMPYERSYGCPVHKGAGVLLKGLDCDPFRGKDSASNPDCPECRETLTGYFSAEGYPLWVCSNCEWQSEPQRPRDSLRHLRLW
jgi:ribosomal protein L37AE/L43A